MFVLGVGAEGGKKAEDGEVDGAEQDTVVLRTEQRRLPTGFRRNPEPDYGDEEGTDE